MIIKVCGLRETENIREVSKLSVDLLGFIFWPESPRFVRMISSQAGIIPDYSEERLKSAKANETAGTSSSRDISRVGVFVDDMPQNIVTRVYNYRLDYVQLHGNESPTMIENLRRTLEPDIKPGIKIIKAFGIEKPEDLNQCDAYEGLTDLFLFDTKTPAKGGSGKPFDWTVLSDYHGHTPFLLSGGIGPDDVEKIKSFRHPLFAGIDLNSRFETEPGVKDISKLKTFIQDIRNE